MTKSLYFNGAQRGKPAIILIVDKGIEVDVDAVVGMVGDKPLYIRWHGTEVGEYIDVHYDLVVRDLCLPQATMTAVGGTFPLGEFDTVLFHLNPALPPLRLKSKKTDDEVRVYNPVRKIIEQQEAREYLDPDLEKLLVLLAECM